MKNIAPSDSEDHSIDARITKIENMQSIGGLNSKSNIIYSKVSNSGKDKYIGLKLTNLNDLKKSTPRLKLPSILNTSTASAKNTPAVPEEIKSRLDKYCRTCAGLKVPLVNIFSEKGIQMRLGQQIEHLEDICERDSLSTQMCMDCICDMKMSYKFFMQIKKAEMKLKSISDSLRDSLSKSNQAEAPSESDTHSEIIRDSPMEELYMSDSDDNGDNFDDSFRHDSECFEEFDPDPADKSEDADVDVVTSDPASPDVSSDTGKHENSAYKYVESLNAYVKVDVDGKPEDVKEDVKQVVLVEKIPKSEPNVPSSESSKRPNILKRKAMNDENWDNANKTDIQKLLKIPKLDLQDVNNIKQEADGVMYVTAKGTKPNEMLLIKVRKVDKSSEKKPEKVPTKKNSLSKLLHKPSSSDKPKPKDKHIERQIEQYKRRRVEILGESANVVADTSFEEEPDIKIANTYSLRDDLLLDEVKDEEDDEISLVLSDLPIDSSEDAVQVERLKQRWKDIKNTHDTAHRDLSEDCTARLKAVLGQPDAEIADFAGYLKNRRIVVSRLKDESIIGLYEAKNNVTIVKPPVCSMNADEAADPFEPVESYQCDFCDQYFPTRDMEFEHAKVHESKWLHYCDDCEREFDSYKAKRAHNVTCVDKLMCKHCDMVLESKGKKRQHEQKHCDEAHGQICDLCGEKFKSYNTLDQHVKTRHTKLDKIYECDQCQKKFALRTKLTFHIKSVHTTLRAYLCEDCGHDFKNPASLRHHKIRKHQPHNNKRECGVCQKMIPVYSMSKHMHTHKSYSIECPHCDKMFKNTSTLKQHLRIHEDQRQHKCDKCGVGFNRRDGLRLHMRVHEKTDSRGLKECSCQLCGEKFPNHSTLVLHRNRTHKDGRTYTCHICNRSMISTQSLEWHLAHIHNEPAPEKDRNAASGDAAADAEQSSKQRVTCQHCDKTFKTDMILRNHVKNTHTEKVPTKCLDCDLEFTSEVRWKHHMMIEHGRTEGTLTCPHCPKRFVNQLRLKTHMIAHSDERPHTCDLCGFMLKTKIQLIKHKQNRHSNERPLQCKYCSWRCKQVSALVCHERTHTNERPYECSVCKQKFKYLGDKNKHERRHESLGGSGFKRLNTAKDTAHSTGNKESKARDGAEEQESEHEQEEEEVGEELEGEEEELGGEEEKEEVEMTEMIDEGEQVEGEVEGEIEEFDEMKFEPVPDAEEAEEVTYERVRFCFLCGVLTDVSLVCDFFNPLIVALV